MNNHPTLEEFKSGISIRHLFSCGKLDVHVWEFNGDTVILERCVTSPAWNMERRNPRVRLKMTPAQTLNALMFEPRTFYYTGVYTDLELAKRDAKRMGGEVDQDPYSDDVWHLVFNDDEKAISAAHELFIKTNTTQQLSKP